MTTCLGKSCSFGTLCVSCVGVCQFVSVLLSLLFFFGGIRNLIVLLPDYCLSIYFDQKQIKKKKKKKKKKK